jgi:hypothetical protein
MPVSGQLDGKSLLYPYLQHDLRVNDIWLFQMLVARLVTSLGIWLSPEVYKVLPIAIPFAARHPHSRGDKANGISDQWGAPTPEGYFMDDNSLVKNLVKSLNISSPSSLLNGKRIEKGFVAAHVWQSKSDGLRSARDPLTYSFIPNVLWLPSDVAKLSDRAGFTQSFLQALSLSIYRDLEIHPEATRITSEAWDLLPDSERIPQEALPSLAQLNFFHPKSGWLFQRIAAIESIANGLNRVAQGKPLEGKVYSTRYTEGIVQLDPAAAGALAKRLGEYVEGARSAIQDYPAEFNV